jgi:methionine-gamma-lyase
MIAGNYEHAIRARAEELATVVVHGGDGPLPYGATDVPIVLSSAFRFDDAAMAAGAFQGTNEAWIYGRWGNPTVEHLEHRLAALEGAAAAATTSSGMAAIAGTLLGLFDAGAHVIAPVAMYAESARLLRERLPRHGITTTFADATDPSSWERALTSATRALYIETPANPTLALTNIAAAVAFARAHGLLVIADNTFATPFAQTPLALGVDVVVHSATKALSGHGDVVGGVVAGSEELVARVREYTVKGIGAVLSPMSAFLIERGIRTFALRQEQANRTAARLATTLARHPAVARVHHPSLASHPQHALAREQMHAFGSMVAFEVAAAPGADALVTGRRVLENLALATHAVSLGDTRTLVVHSASTTHSTMPAETRRAAGIADGLLRLSVGLEGAADLERDVLRALERAWSAA